MLVKVYLKVQVSTNDFLVKAVPDSQEQSLEFLLSTDCQLTSDFQ